MNWGGRAGRVIRPGPVKTLFAHLNVGWNAEPNITYPEVLVSGRDLIVSFPMNPFRFSDFDPGDVGNLRFVDCWRYRVGGPNDEGWFMGQCRFSGLAPEWGEFYEVTGDLLLDRCRDGWVELADTRDKSRHFLFYFKEATFECDATDWSLEVVKARS